MPITNKLIEVFIDRVVNAITFGLDTLNNDNLGSPKLLSALKIQSQQNNMIKPQQLPVLDLLPKAIQTAASGPPYVKELLEKLKKQTEIPIMVKSKTIRKRSKKYHKGTLTRKKKKIEHPEDGVYSLLNFLSN